MRQILPITWTVGPCVGPDDEPAESVPANVPGAAQLDWAHAHHWPPHTFGDEPRRYAGLEDRYWAYRCRLPARPADDRELWLVLDGVDHTATVRLDGRTIGTVVGLQQAHAFRLDRAVTGGLLEVRVHPAPKFPGATGRARARATTKPAVSYGWDFHPELIPLGLWREARLELRPVQHLTPLRVRYRLAPDFSFAELIVPVTGHVELELRDPAGAVVWRGDGRVRHPRLWWPAGHGPQDRYRLLARLLDTNGHELDRQECSVGFRHVQLVMAPGQWDEPATFPKSRSHPPMTLVINGRRIFAKGANVSPLDIFPGAVTADHARSLVRHAAAANMNLLRLWGGGPAPRQEFYDECDARGIMVLQEFPLACNHYPDDPAYLTELAGEACAMLARLDSHPCVVVWCGGNELFNAWSGMTDQSHALRLLGALCWQEAPDTPFLPTMPLDGFGHGHYLFRDPRTGDECFQLFQNARGTAYTEFGVPGPADADLIRSVIPAERLWPPRPDEIWRLHAGFAAWDVEPTSYLCLSTLEHYWGPPRDLADLVVKGQWLQREGLRAIFEEARRQRPRCGWALMWCLNEPWPNVANQCLLSHPLRPKPALAAVREALRPTLASARVAKFQWQPGELFTADLYLLHDAPHSRPAGNIAVVLASGSWQERLLVWEYPDGPADTDIAGPTVRCRLPDVLGDDLVLKLIAAVPSWSSHYHFATAGPRPGCADTSQRGLNA